ncbi:MAG: hypothetical protein SFV22_02915 [Saprospiraceae bacterium]|nr:hypothetical protein [Saprospiraceae bacterium]
MKNDLLALLSDGKTAEVIAQLRQLSLPEGELHRLIVQTAARFAGLERQVHAGERTFTEADTERNKINAALLAIIEKLPESAGQTKKTKPNRLKIGGWLAAAIGLAAAVAQLSGYSLKDLFAPATPPVEIQQPAQPLAADTLPPPTPQAAPRPVQKPAKTTPSNNRFESRDQSKQVNAPDNSGTIIINQ